MLQRAYLPAWFEAVQGLGNPVMSAYLQGLLLTGCRREELAELKWQDVDFRWGSIWVKDKVAEEGRKIPLTLYLSHLLANLPRRNQWVFSSPTADGKIAEPRIPHNRALSVAGLDHVTLHGLPRTFASLAEWGWKYPPGLSPKSWDTRPTRPPSGITSTGHLNCWRYGMASMRLGFLSKPESSLNPNRQGRACAR